MSNGRFHWREFWLLWGTGIAGTLAVLPYAFTLLKPMMTRTPLPPLAVLLPLQLAQSAVLLAAAVGLSAPLSKPGWAARRYAHNCA